jgi:hypothetical protein
MADIPKWWMKSDWFDVCSCNIPCPCTFAQAPTNNHYETVIAYHIHEGEYCEINLDGLRVVGLVRIDGKFWSGEAALITGTGLAIPAAKSARWKQR